MALEKRLRSLAHVKDLEDVIADSWYSVHMNSNVTSWIELDEWLNTCTNNYCYYSNHHLYFCEEEDAVLYMLAWEYE